MEGFDVVSPKENLNSSLKKGNKSGLSTGKNAIDHAGKKGALE